MTKTNKTPKKYPIRARGTGLTKTIVETFAKIHDMSQSEAIRQLIWLGWLSQETTHQKENKV